MVIVLHELRSVFIILLEVVVYKEAIYCMVCFLFNLKAFEKNIIEKRTNLVNCRSCALRFSNTPYKIS